MGGSALQQKGVSTRRHTTQELLHVIAAIKQDIYYWGSDYNLDKSMTVNPTRWCTNKETHGDLDLLMFPTDPNAFHRNIGRFLYNMYNATVIKNGNVITFNYGQLQVDLIVCNPDEWAMSNAWYGLNDLSVIIGRVYRFWHLKWSPKGLFYPVHTDNRSAHLEDILLTRDPKQALEFLGYSYERFIQDFRSEEDVFEYVISSKLFSGECCDPKYMSNDVRTRDNKRTSVKRFDTWIKENNKKYEYFPRPSHENTLNKINDEFHDLQVPIKISDLLADHAKKKIVSEKFNGHIIMEHFPDLQGEKLGTAIKKFKYNFDDKYDDYILKNSLEKILKDFSTITQLPS